MNRALLGLAFWLGLPSTALLQKYFGLAGVAAYLLGLVLALLLWPRFGRCLPRPGAAFLEKQFPWLALLTCAALLGLFALAYPITNNGRTGDRRTSGSDTDDALNLATTELLHGRYPYYPRTYLDNPITPMPGALLLAIPFVLLGNSAYQSFFWLLLWLLAMRRHWQAGRPPLLLLWLMLALSPVVVYSLVVGNDYLANSLYVLLFMLWLVRWAPRPGLNPWLKLLPAICLGIGLSSRANFLLLLPLIFATLAQLAGRPAALRSTVTTGLTFLLVTLPFYLYDPAGFSPLHTTDELGRFNHLLPYAGLLIPLATALLALFLAWRQRVGADLQQLFRSSALVLALPVLAGLALALLAYGPAGFTFAFFGLFPLFFGATASWHSAVCPRPHLL